MPTPVRVILNPRAGDGAGRRARAEIEREFARRAVAFELEETDGPGHAVDLARAAARDRVGTVVAAGGDGTIHEVANGLLEARDPTGNPGPALGVIPVGTGNDFIKAVAGRVDRRSAYDLIAEGAIRRFDAGLVEWDGGREYFINGVGTGIDVEVVRQIRRLPRLRGVASYLVGLLRALARFRPIPLRIRLDGRELERNVMIVAVANGHCLGGGFYICPDAAPDDGRLDICIVNELGLARIARVLPRVLRGTHTRQPGVTMHAAQAVEITAAGPAPLYFQIDGELREPAAARSLRIRIEPGALPVIGRASGAPASGPRVAAGRADGSGGPAEG